MYNTRGLAKNNRINAIKIIYSLTTSTLSSSIYSPPQSLLCSIWIFDSSKQSSKSFSVIMSIVSTAFYFTASTGSKLVPFNTSFTLGNKTKSHTEQNISDEKGGCSNRSFPYLAKYLLIFSAVWDEALS